MMMREDGATNVIINERVMSDEFARLLFKILLFLHASDQAAKGWSSSCVVQLFFVCYCALREWKKYKYAMTRVFFVFLSGFASEGK